MRLFQQPISSFPSFPTFPRRSWRHTCTCPCLRELRTWGRVHPGARHGTEKNCITLHITFQNYLISWTYGIPGSEGVRIITCAVQCSALHCKPVQSSKRLHCSRPTKRCKRRGQCGNFGLEITRTLRKSMRKIILSVEIKPNV